MCGSMFASPIVDVGLQILLKFTKRYLAVAVFIGRARQAQLQKMTKHSSTKVQRTPCGFTARSGVQNGQVTNARFGNRLCQSVGKTILQ